MASGLLADRGNRRRLGVSSRLIHGEQLEARTLLTSAIAFSISGTSSITEDATDGDNNNGNYTIDYTGTLTGGDTASVNVAHVLNQTVGADYTTNVVTAINTAVANTPGTTFNGTKLTFGPVAGTTTSASKYAGAASTAPAPDNLPWTSPGGAAGSNVADYAHVVIADRKDRSDYLVLTNFGFNIPTNAIVNGITVTLNTAGSDQQRDGHGIRLTKDGANQIGTAPNTAADWSTGSVVVAGGLWGTTWQPSEINAASFGLRIRVRPQDDDFQFRVRTAQIVVSYTTPGSAAPTSLNFTANIADDTIAEPDESYFVTLGNPTSTNALGATIATGSVSTTIVDNDPHEIDADDDYATTNEDTPVAIYPLENDLDPVGHSLTVANVVSTNGVATVNGSGVLTLVPSLNFHGTATITYQATDGLLFSNTATIYIDVASVNDAPTTTNPGNATFTEGENVSVYVPAADVDLPNDFLTWSATGMPPGMVIQIVTGRLLGKLTYASAGTYNLTVTVTDTAGATASTTFEWTILDAGFDTLTATESHGFLLPNSIMVPGATTILYVAPLNDVSLSVAAIAPKALANLDDVRYVVTNGATPATGDFNPTPVITVGAAGAIHVVTAWLDEDSDSVLDPGEFSLSLTIQVVDFGSAKVFGARVAGGVLYPGEDLLFIKTGELFDVTSTFEYKLIPEPDTLLGPGAIVRGQLIRPSTGTVFGNSGTIGESFSVLLTSAMVGPAQVRFYLDANFNGSWDTGELVRTSNPFEIVERNHLTRTYQYNIYYPITQGDVQSAVDASMALALSKDTDDDWRAAVYTTVTAAAIMTFTPGHGPGLLPDAAESEADVREHLDAHDGMSIIQTMKDPGPPVVDWYGMAYANSNRLAIDWTQKGVETIVHELGHNLGLYPTGHNTISSRYIMYQYGNQVDQNLLTHEEALVYSGISSTQFAGVGLSQPLIAAGSSQSFLGLEVRQLWDLSVPSINAVAFEIWGPMARQDVAPTPSHKRNALRIAPSLDSPSWWPDCGLRLSLPPVVEPPFVTDVSILSIDAAIQSG